MERRFELDILRAVALFLLFVFHTNLNAAYPNQLWTIGTYLLGAFFFVSGILFLPSIERHPTKNFLKNKFLRIYVPFLLLLILYFALFTGPVQAYIYHATGLSIFHVLQSGTLNLFHMWFVVHLLAYFLLFLAIYKLIKSDNRRHFATIFIFLILVLLWTMNSPLRLEWKFVSYLLIFYAGTVVGNNLDRIYSALRIKQTIGLLVVTLLLGFLVLTVPETATTYISTIFFILMRSAFAISACLLSLRVFLQMNKLRKVADFISCGSLFTYLLQPAVSQLVSCTIAGNNCFVLGAWDALSMTSTLIMIPVSFLITILLAHGIQTYYNSFLKRIKM